MRNLLILIMCVVFIGIESVHAARTAFRLNSDPDLIDYYINNPNDYPVCKSELTYMHFDLPVNSTKRKLFDTDMAFVEIGSYGATSSGFTRADVQMLSPSCKATKMQGSRFTEFFSTEKNGLQGEPLARSRWTCAFFRSPTSITLRLPWLPQRSIAKVPSNCSSCWADA